MRVVVTGSAGRLGRVVVRDLVSRGHVVTAIDRQHDPDPVTPDTRVADLADPGAWAAALDGADAVVHAAAIPGDQADPADLARENLEVSASLALHARRAGVARFVQVSSIQVIGSERAATDESARVDWLPLSGDSPPRPANSYAWSKLGAEVAVRAALAGSPVRCVILRLPWLVDAGDSKHRYRSLRSLDERQSACVVEQGFSYLSFADAASLIAACLVADLPELRVYLPAVCAVAPEAIGPCLARYYRGVPLRDPELSSLIELESIERETGWRPAHVIRLTPPPPQPRPDWLTRLMRRRHDD